MLWGVDLCTFFSLQCTASYSMIKHKLLANEWGRQAACSFQLVSTGLFPLKYIERFSLGARSKHTRTSTQQIGIFQKIMQILPREGTKNNNPKNAQIFLLFVFVISFVNSRIVLRSTLGDNDGKRERGGGGIWNLFFLSCNNNKQVPLIGPRKVNEIFKCRIPGDCIKWRNYSRMRTGTMMKWFSSLVVPAESLFAAMNRKFYIFQTCVSLMIRITNSFCPVSFLRCHGPNTIAEKNKCTSLASCLPNFYVDLKYVHKNIINVFEFTDRIFVGSTRISRLRSMLIQTLNFHVSCS